MFLFIILFYFSKEYSFIDGSFSYSIINPTKNEVQIVNCTNITDTEIRIPNYVSFRNTNYTIVSISSKTFKAIDIKSIKTVYFPYFLRDIGNGTFSKFTNLQKIGYIDQEGEFNNDFLPPNITTLNSSIFYNCFKLKTVQTSGYLKNIGDYAFSNCSSLELFETVSINFTIGIGSFSNCKKMTNFDFHQIYLIKERAFEGCTSLEKVNITNTTIEKIDRRTFFNCTSLKQVLFPNTTNSIDEFSFMNCIQIRDLFFPYENNYWFISKSAFENCIGLVSVVFRLPPLMIGSKAFYSCISLQSVHVLENPFSALSATCILDKAFMNCTLLTDFDFDNLPIHDIGDYAFYGCPLKSSIVFLPENLHNKFQFEKHSFSSSLIESIDFGTPRTFLGRPFTFDLNNDSFSDCKNVSCVMVSKNHEDAIAVAFNKELINGKNCPNYEDKKPLRIGIIVGVVCSVVIVFVVIIFCVVKLKRNRQLNAYPLLNDTTDFNINTIDQDQNQNQNNMLTIENNEVPTYIVSENNDSEPIEKPHVMKMTVY